MEEPRRRKREEQSGISGLTHRYRRELVRRLPRLLPERSQVLARGHERPSRVEDVLIAVVDGLKGLPAAQFNSSTDAGAPLRCPCRLAPPAFGKSGIPS